ncbi:MAG TPA: hypothetical protein VEL10_10990 [Gaiellaceae bacterium]|nr:hypothetical protein [Gaiellaceae bacterium]
MAQVHGQNGNGHHGREQRRAERGYKTRCDQEAAADLSQRRAEDKGQSRPQTELFEEACRGARTGCVQQRRRRFGGHELLQPMADEKKSRHEPQYQ